MSEQSHKRHKIRRQLAWWRNIKQVKEKVRTLVIATRELQGVVMDPDHVALAWREHFAAFQRVFQRWRKDLVLGNEQEEDSDHGQVFALYLHGHQRRLGGVHRGNTRWLCGVQSCQRRPREDAADPVFSTASVAHPGDCCHMTTRENPQSLKSIRCELMYVPCMRIFLLQSARSHPSHVVCTVEIQLSWLDAGTSLGALVVKQP